MNASWVNRVLWGPVPICIIHTPPTNWTRIDGPLIHRAFDTNLLKEFSDSPWHASTLLENTHLSIRIWHADQSMDHLVRNADGDELLFIHKGEGELYCDYGHLHFETGDYIMIPRGTLWRVEIPYSVEILLIEATQQDYQLPDKGILGEHAIFDPGILDVPQIDDAFKAQQGENEWNIVIKRLDEMTQMVYPYNPLDALGWQGTLMPVRINWRDIRPLMSHRYHLPPIAHTTFLTENFMVSTFVPRPMESDPDALRVPFYHSNDDYDEIIFYHQGNFFSRDNIEAGMITFHPCGIPHGPHPKAYETGQKYARKETDEVAVMIDSRFPLTATSQAESIENKDYVNA
ncbi:homogentisate 1,2-dioxygenase, partial [Beggiatoa alba]|nr:homogentisate 1,2-dioxygenase [Beggiatoa alba]